MAGMMKGRWLSMIAGALLAVLLVPGAQAEAKPARKPPVKRASQPEVHSAAALVVNGDTGEVLFERKATLVAPIASITKLMTALVVIDGQQPLDEVITLSQADVWKGKGAHSRLAVGAKLTREELLKLALMASENRAARVLARTYPGGIPAFVKTMNLKAKALGMTQSRFADASGLANENVSSAKDLAKLIVAASRDSRIREFSTLRTLEVRVGKSMLMYRNTNLLVGKPDWDILVQKTGFTNDAGQCLVLEAMIDEQPVVMVLLNSFGTLTRTADARRIRRWMEKGDRSIYSQANK
jgi:serine-type D-Ala-D-Ala endopeptidase (penicillin-binding protein 7)